MKAKLIKPGVADKEIPPTERKVKWNLHTQELGTNVLSAGLTRFTKENVNLARKLIWGAVMRTKRVMMFITFIICTITSCSAPTGTLNSGCFEDEAAIVSPDGIVCIAVDDLTFDADNLRLAE